MGIKRTKKRTNLVTKALLELLITANNSQLWITGVQESLIIVMFQPQARPLLQPRKA